MITDAGNSLHPDYECIWPFSAITDPSNCSHRSSTDRDVDRSNLEETLKNGTDRVPKRFTSHSVVSHGRHGDELPVDNGSQALRSGIDANNYCVHCYP